MICMFRRLSVSDQGSPRNQISPGLTSSPRTLRQTCTCPTRTRARRWERLQLAKPVCSVLGPFPLRDSCEVKSGHYVEVWPTPLPDPKLVIYSQEVADMLGIPEDEVP